MKKVIINEKVLQNAIKKDQPWLVVDKQTGVALAALGDKATAQEIAIERSNETCKVVAIKDVTLEVEKVERRGRIEVTPTHAESKIEGPCKRVWAIADMFPEKGRKEIIDICVEEGIAYNTARTQYQYWFEAQKEAIATRLKENLEKARKVKQAKVKVK